METHQSKDISGQTESLDSTAGYGEKIFLVLVPHRDIRRALQKYNDALFKEGFYDVYQFPCVVPLALLSRPFNPGELKHFACSLRELFSAKKFSAGDLSVIKFPEKDSKTAIFGSRLVINNLSGGNESILFNYENIDKIISLFSPPVIGIYLLEDSSDIALPEALWKRIIDERQLSFRAAAAANMYWQPMYGKSSLTDKLNSKKEIIGYKWKIGKLYWLPAVKKGVK